MLFVWLLWSPSGTLLLSKPSLMYQNIWKLLLNVLLAKRCGKYTYSLINTLLRYYYFVQLFLQHFKQRVFIGPCVKVSLIRCTWNKISYKKRDPQWASSLLLARWKVTRICEIFDTDTVDWIITFCNMQIIMNYEIYIYNLQTSNTLIT